MKSQRELARMLASKDHRPSGMSTPQLSHSSIENGSIKEYDGDGQLVSEVGRQWDGSHGVYPLTGPTPPRPTAPVATGGISATLGWDGLFLDEGGKVDLMITAPMDWSRVELHISQVSGFRADGTDTLVDTIESPRGGSRPVLLEPGTWYAVLVARSLAGKRGEQSPETEFEVTALVGADVDVDALREEFTKATDSLQMDLEENAAELLALTQGPVPDATAENIAAAVGRFIKVTTDQLVAGSAQLGEAVARKLAAETGAFMKLTANQVFIGEAGNMERDPNFEQLDSWLPIFLSDPIIYRNNGKGYNGANAMSFPVTTVTDEVSGAWRYNSDGRFSFPVEAGEKYRVSCWVQPDKDIPAQGVAIYLRASTPTGGFWGVEVEESAQNPKPIKAGVWTKITGIVTMPENATSAFLGYFRFSNSRNAVIKFSTPNVQQAITPSLIVDGFFQGLRVIGASLETNADPETGLKMDDNGLTAYGKSEVTYGDTTDLYKVRAIVDSRVNQWGDRSTEALPGFWLESEPADGSGTPPLFAAGLTITETDALAARMRSAMEMVESPYGEVEASPGAVNLNAYGPLIPGGSHRETLTALGLTHDGFNLSSVGSDYKSKAQVQHLGDGVLRLNAKNGILVNGSPIGSGGGGGITKIAEYRCTGTIANFDTANQDISTPILFEDGTNAPGLASVNKGTLTVAEAGVYSADFQFLVGRAVTGRSFLDIADIAGTTYSRTTIAIGEDQATGVLSGVFLPAGATLRFRAIQTTGGSRNYTAKIRLIRNP